MLNQPQEYPQADFRTRLFGEMVLAQSAFDAINNFHLRLNDPLPQDGRYVVGELKAAHIGGDIYEVHITFRLRD